MAGVHLPGTKLGTQLGEPFQADRRYLEKRDPALLRAVGADLSEETYELLDHCDKAGTGNNDSVTQAQEVTAQWNGKERLPAQLRVILAQLPECFALEDVEPGGSTVARVDTIRQEIVGMPGGFEPRAEPRLYLSTN